MEAKEAAQQVYGQSWGDMLRESASNAPDQPETESEDVEVAEPEETVYTDEDTAESVEDQPETESEPTAPTFNDDTEIEMGEDRKPLSLKELKEGYQRQSDYTKKTQELATQRKEVEAERERMKPAVDFMAHMDANPWLWGQINQALQEFQNSGVLPLEDALADAQYGKYINHLVAENNRLKRDLDAANGEREGLKLSSELTKLQTELKSEYGDLVTDDYMQSLQDRAKNEKLSFSVLKDVADGHLAKQKLKSAPNVKAETRKAAAAAVQKLQEVRKQAPATPKPSAQAPASAEPDRSGDWGDFFRRLSGK